MTNFQNIKSTSIKKLGNILKNNLHLRMPDFKTSIVFWAIFLGGLVLDLWSKHLIFKKIGSHHQSINVIDGFFRLVAWENEGAAFGLAAGHRMILVAVSIIALLVILGMYFFAKIEHRALYIGLAMFAAGVTGNLYDRVFNWGRVRDFIDIVYWPGHHWPAFNVADALLCIGVGLMLMVSFFKSQKAD